MVKIEKQVVNNLEGSYKNEKKKKDL